MCLSVFCVCVHFCLIVANCLSVLSSIFAFLNSRAISSKIKCRSNLFSRKRTRLRHECVYAIINRWTWVETLAVCVVCSVTPAPSSELRGKLTNFQKHCCSNFHKPLWLCLIVYACGCESVSLCISPVPTVLFPRHFSGTQWGWLIIEWISFIPSLLFLILSLTSILLYAHKPILFHAFYCLLFVLSLCLFPYSVFSLLLFLLMFDK